MVKSNIDIYLIVVFIYTYKDKIYSTVDHLNDHFILYYIHMHAYYLFTANIIIMDISGDR